MPIGQNITRKIQDVRNDKTLAIGDRMSDEAFDAIVAGIGSPEWATFMKNFADAQNPKELARLTFKDAQGKDPVVMKNVVYLAATSVCGAITIQLIPSYVNTEILDKTLDCQPANPEPPAAGGGD